MKRQHVLLLAATVLGCTATASADKIRVSVDGIAFHMKETSMPTLFSNAPDHSFTGAELRSIHQSINNAGINTEGKVTFVFLNTNAGLSLFALVDSNLNGGPKVMDAALGLQTSSTGADNFVMNDSNFFADGGTHSNNGDTQSLTGDFFWHPDGGATGMAWTGLRHGDTGNFDFTAFLGDGDTPSTFAGLTANNKFQFISWTGTTWNHKYKGNFDSSGSFSFAFAVVPLPPAIALGLAGLGMVAVVRRRRHKKARHA